VRADFNQIRPLVSNLHTRKTFFAKALAGLAGLGLLGGARAVAKSANSSPSAAPGEAAAKASFTVRADPRSVARSGDSL
jgi:hypothetical protein